MNIIRLSVTFIFGLIISSSNLFAQEDYFKLSGQYRLRTELRYGYKSLVTDTSKVAFFIAQRARIVFDLKKDNIEFKTSIQDSRTWGDEEQKKDLAGLQVNELWVQFQLKEKYFFKLGRQELVYDDHRLLGNLDWANLTISHDALLFKYINNTHKFSIHLGGAFNQSGELLSGTKYSLKNYKLLGFAYIKKVFSEKHTLSGIAIANGLNSLIQNDEKMKATLTLGPLYSLKTNFTNTTLGAYYQTGKTDQNLNQNAFMINASSEIEIKKFKQMLGFDYLSGNSAKKQTNESQSFSTLYATNHKFYGYMDYFLNIPNDAKNLGLMDVYSRTTFHLSKKLSTYLDYHYFFLANKGNIGLNKVNQALGSEIDALLEYKPSQIINVQVGYSFLLGTKNLEYIKGGNADKLNTWAFVMLKVSPTFLNNEIK